MPGLLDKLAFGVTIEMCSIEILTSQEENVMTKKLEEFVAKEQFMADAVSRTKQILNIVAGGIDEALLQRARAGEATEAEMVQVCAGMFAGQAALFQALHSNISKLAKHGLIDQQTGTLLCASIRAMSNATMADIVDRGPKTGLKSADVIPFPGSQKVH